MELTGTVGSAAGGGCGRRVLVLGPCRPAVWRPWRGVEIAVVVKVVDRSCDSVLHVQ